MALEERTKQGDRGRERLVPAVRPTFLVLAVLATAVTIQIGLMRHIDGRAYGDCLKAVNFGYLLDTGAYSATRDVVNSKTFVGPWLSFQLYTRWGLAGLRAANVAAFLIIALLVLALGRRRFAWPTRLVALHLFVFYVGTQRSIVAGELDDQIATALLAAGVLLLFERRSVLAACALVGFGFLFKFWVAIFGVGLVAYLAAVRRFRDLPVALFGLGLPFLVLSLLDDGASLGSLLISLGIQRNFSSWPEVAFKSFSTGLVPIAALTAAAWSERGRTDPDTLLMSLATPYVVYVFLARDAHAASTMMMPSLVFSSPLVAEWLTRRDWSRPRWPTTLGLALLYVAATTSVAYFNLWRDTRPMRLVATPAQAASMFPYNPLR
jgi:hypothetical protein